MGSFSWLRADVTTNHKNIAYGDKFKMLIPKEFGGGYLVDNYQDYGNIAFGPNKDNKLDMYEILAFWNANEPYKDGIVKDYLQYDGEFPITLQDIFERAKGNNRIIGIEIGCYDYQIKKLKYPLKLVSYEYNGTYEDCEHRSYGDPEQGFRQTLWNDNLLYLEPVPEYPIDDNKQDIFRYWHIVCKNEMIKARIEYLQASEQRKKQYDQLKMALDYLSSGFHIINGLMKSKTINCQAIIEENNPFDINIEELSDSVDKWVNTINKKI